MDIYTAYKQLEGVYPEKEFWNICLAEASLGIAGIGLIIRDWETKTSEEDARKRRFLAFHAELKKLLEN